MLGLELYVFKLHLQYNWSLSHTQMFSFDFHPMIFKVRNQTSFAIFSLQRTLEREVRGCQILIIWTDCDREGENIGFEVIDVCQTSEYMCELYSVKYLVIAVSYS